MMGSAFMDGAMQGFSMMERHKDREFRRNRLIEQDELMKERHEKHDKQQRLNNLLQLQESGRRATEFAEKAKHFGKPNTLATMKAEVEKDKQDLQEQKFAWQKNQAEEKKRWAIAQNNLPTWHQQYFETGVLPESAQKFFKDYPDYNDFNPESYVDESYRASIDRLHTATQQAFQSGNIQQINTPEYMDLFNGVFKSKVKQGIGEYNHVLDAEVIDKRVAQLIPMENGQVTIGLEVKYKSSSGEEFTQIQPMTVGRTAEGDDPVKQIPLKELFAGLETRKRMAYMAENKDKFIARSKSALGVDDSKQHDLYNKERSALEKEMRLALNEVTNNIQADPDARASIEGRYFEALNRLNKRYGKEPEFDVNKGDSTTDSALRSTKEGYTPEQIISKIIDKNPSISPEQAKQIALQQGYLTNG